VNSCECCEPWPEGFWFIDQLREAVGLPVCALSMTCPEHGEPITTLTSTEEDDGD
jgi:hypothetical protein